MAYAGKSDLFNDNGKLRDDLLPEAQTGTLTKDAVEAVLIGEITSHTHPASVAVTPTSWGKYF